jgi:hypothetical protein
MRAVLRLFFVIPLAFVLACLAAGLVFVVAVIGPGPDAAYLVDRLPETLLLAAGVSAIAGGFGAVPALVAVVLAEIFGWRSLYLYLLAGLLAGLSAAVAATSAAGMPAPDMPAMDMEVGSQVFLAAGAVGGFVYWLLAGRNAGLTQPTRSSSARESRGNPSPSPLAGEGPGEGKAVRDIRGDAPL